MLMAMIAVSDSFVNSNFQDETIRIPLQKWGLGQKWGPVHPLRLQPKPPHIMVRIQLLL